jgi:signal peptidase II
MRTRSKRVLLLLTASAVYIIDRLTKLAALRLLESDRSIEILSGVFHITMVRNRGAAFGLFKDHTGIFVAISLAVIAAIIIYVWRGDVSSSVAAVSLGLILGGSAGNLVDRIRYGHVVDFLDFRVWPVFNVADSCITAGAAVLVFVMLVKNVKRKT